MNILLDANLSWRLIKALKEDFINVKHVDSIGLESRPKDTSIWLWAKTNDYCIISNDEDFYNLLEQRGFPPKIVILKTRNQSTNYIANLIIKHRNDINDLIQSSDYGLLELI